MRLNQVMRRVKSWLEEHGLDLGVIDDKEIPTILPTQMDTKAVETQNAFKYLGLLIDTNLTSWEKIKIAAAKAATITVVLLRIF